MLVKLYGEPSHSPEAARRYSPTECVGRARKRSPATPIPGISARPTPSARTSRCGCRCGGLPGGQTHSQRTWKTTRTLVTLYALWYNFVRIHKTLRVTPAMAAGIADRLWSMEDVV